MDFLGKLIIAFIQLFLGSRIAFKFQKRSFHYQDKIRRSQDKSKKIIQISSEISEASTIRRIRTSNLLEQISSSANNAEINLQEYRKLYKESVEDWNIMLNKQNISLNNVGLYEIAKNNLEGEMHKKFIEVHNIIRKEIKKIENQEQVSTTNINQSLINLGITQKMTLKITEELLKRADNENEKSEEYILEELSKENLKDATLFELIKALHSRSDRFCIKRPVI